MAIAAIAMTSCKKEEVVSTELGEATIRGNVYADLDYTNDIDAAGLYSEGLVHENVAGLTVTVEVNTYYWDQTPDNSYDYAVKTYTATTDAEGNYELTIPATDESYQVAIEFGNLYTTRSEFAVDGVSVLEENVRVGGNTVYKNIYAGATVNTSDAASVLYVDGSADEYGSATVRVVINANWDQGPNSIAGYDDLTGSSVIGKMVEMSYVNGYAPYGNGYDNLWSVALTASGIVEFTIPTYPATSTNQIGVKYRIADFAGTYLYNDGGVEATQDAIWYNLGFSNTYGIYDGDIVTVNLYASFQNI